MITRSGMDKSLYRPGQRSRGAYLEWERQDFKEALDEIRQGYNDVTAGRTRPAPEFLAEVRRKYGFPG